MGSAALEAEKKRGPDVGARRPRDSTGTSSRRSTTSYGLPPSLPGRRRATRCRSTSTRHQVGQATSHTWSPMLKKYLALATVRADVRAARHRAPDRAHRRVRAPHRARRASSKNAVLRSRARSGSHDAARNTTPSSSAPATTASSARPTSRRPGKQGARARAAARASAAPRSREEIFPGFTFSAARYVVCLLRPKIIRDLELPKHGLRASCRSRRRSRRCLDGRTCCAARSASATRREIAQFCQRDAEVYRGSARRWPSCRGSSSRSSTRRRPIRRRSKPRELFELLRMGSIFEGRRATTGVAAQPQDDDDERGRLPLRVVRVRAAHRADVGERHHRHLPRRALARHRLRAAAPLHGRDRRLVPRVGLRRRAAPARSRTPSPRRRARCGVEIRTEAPVDARPASRTARRRGVVLENGDEIHAKAVISRRRSAPHVPEARRREAPRRRLRHADQALQDARLARGKVNLALDRLPQLHVPAGRRARTCRATSPSRRRSTTSSAPTTTRSTASSRSGRS